MGKTAMDRRSGIRIEVILTMSGTIPLHEAFSAEQAAYFGKKEYVRRPLPTFASDKDKRPSPVFDKDPNYIRCYWKAWELALKNFREPVPDSGLRW
jgi:hypothetical protein